MRLFLDATLKQKAKTDPAQEVPPTLVHFFGYDVNPLMVFNLQKHMFVCQHAPPQKTQTNNKTKNNRKTRGTIHTHTHTNTHTQLHWCYFFCWGVGGRFQPHNPPPQQKKGSHRGLLRDSSLAGASRPPSPASRPPPPAASACGELRRSFFLAPQGTEGPPAVFRRLTLSHISTSKNPKAALALRS